MGALDHQLMVKDEVTYGTPVTPDRTFEYESEDIEENEGRTEGNPLRVGSGFKRSDRFTPYFAGASGPVQMAVMTKGFGWWLKHMMGTVGTAGPAETTVYTHTGSEGTLLGDSFTCQVNRPFHPSGTNQAFTFEGGKVTEWGLSNTVDGNLLCDLGLDFEQVATATALATAGYPASMDNLSWAGGLITIGGTNTDVSEIAINVNNGYDVDRRQIRRNTDKKEPTAGEREGTFSLKLDFDSLVNRNRAHAAVRADALAALVASWRGPTLLGSTIYPELSVSIASVRFDAWKGATEGKDAIQQEVSGVIRYDGSTSPLVLTYKSADTTP